MPGTDCGAQANIMAVEHARLIWLVCVAGTDCNFAINPIPIALRRFASDSASRMLVHEKIAMGVCAAPVNE